MTEDEYLGCDAVRLAELVAANQITALEALEAAEARMAKVNPKINAVTMDLSERAKREAVLPASGPLAGVPFLLKDLGPLLAGTPTTSSSKLFKDDVASADSALTRLYRRAGLVIFGKTNTPEFGLEPVTEPAMFGPTRNPWDLSRTAGGSSGGAAAAVAAGIVPTAHASDGGGSIRIPASACGLFGLKPSRGRISPAPKNEGWGGYSCMHVVSRTVRDSAAFLDVAAKPQPGDPYWAAPPAHPYADDAARDPKPLRIAVYAGGFATETIDPECAEAARAAGKLCEGLGHHVEEAAPPIDRGQLGFAGLVIAANVAADLDALAETRGRPIAEDEVEPGTWATYGRGKAIDSSTYVRALRAAHLLGRRMAAFFESHDVLITSTLGRPAIPVGHLHEPGLGQDGFVQRLFEFMPNTQIFNMTGQPAASVPLAWSSGGLPIGVQFVARAGEDGLLLQLAGQLERAQPWAGKRPAL
jgi:Asp-tRNA(Asn)/Glu-tRNA(Gln) amidotransferase A subunit family amidase